MSDELSHGQTWWRKDWRTDTGNDNTRGPELASGKNRYWTKKDIQYTAFSGELLGVY